MLIILEGPDGAGKTTLAAELAGYLATLYPDRELRVLHKGPPTEHPLREYEHPLVGYRAGGNVDIICDRWHLGEVVYPTIFGRPSQLTPEVLWHIESYLLRLGALLVECSAPPAVLTSRLEARGDDLVDASMINGLVDGYLTAVNQTRLRVTWSTTLATIATAANEQARSYRGLADYQTYLGPRFPSLLLLGDTRKDPEDPAAFLPWSSSSGRYLIRTLQRCANDGVRAIGIANAVDTDDPEALWLDLGEPEVVALGKRAAKALSRTKVPYRTVAHPQYVRRFHHAESAAYAAWLLEGTDPQWN